MKTLQVVVVLLFIVLAVAGCSLQCGTPRTEEGTAAGIQPPPQPPTPPAETPQAGPKVKVLQVGHGYDEEASKVIHQTNTFAPDTSEIHVSAGITGLKTGDKITGTLKAVEVTTKEGTKVRDEQVASTDIVAPGEESTAHFNFSAPTAGWPQGSYVVEIAVEGEVIDTVDLTVK